MKVYVLPSSQFHRINNQSCAIIREVEEHSGMPKGSVFPVFGDSSLNLFWETSPTTITSCSASEWFLRIARKLQLLQDERSLHLSTGDEEVAREMLKMNNKEQVETCSANNIEANSTIETLYQSYLEDSDLLDSTTLSKCLLENKTSLPLKDVSLILIGWLGKGCRARDTLDAVFIDDTTEYFTIQIEDSLGEDTQSEKSPSTPTTPNPSPTPLPSPRTPLPTPTHTIHLNITPTNITELDQPTTSTTVPPEPITNPHHAATTVLGPSELDVYTLYLQVAYVRLLVNKEDELALARALSAPAWELRQEEFTGIKHYGKEKKLSMYQAIYSFHRNLELGYPQPPTHPLVPLQPMVVEFMELMEKLYVIMEEGVDFLEDAKRIINTVAKYHRRKSSSHMSQSLLRTSCWLKNLLDGVWSQLNQYEGVEPSPRGLGGNIAGREILKLLRGLCDKVSTSVSDSLSFHCKMDADSIAHETPQRFTLINFFRSPEVLPPQPKQPLPKPSKAVIKETKPKPPKEPIPTSDDDKPLASSQPTKKETTPTLLRTTNEKENLCESQRSETPVAVTTKSQGNVRKAGEVKSKRSLFADVTNEQPRKKVKMENNRKTSVKKVAKKKTQPLLKGQTTLASFFRV